MAVLQAVLFLGYLGPVADQEAGAAGELVGLLGDDDDRQFLVGKIGARKVDSLGGVVLVDVDNGGLGTAAAGRLECLQRFGGRLFFCLAWGVVIGSHSVVHFRCCTAPFRHLSEAV